MKYHSGRICSGVTREFAGVKLSGSVKMYGSLKVNTLNIMMVIMVIGNIKISFTVKQGWNGILSVFLFNPIGLFDPVWCRNSKWINTICCDYKWYYSSLVPADVKILKISSSIYPIE